VKNRKNLLTLALSSLLIFLLFFNVLSLCIPALESLHSDCASFGHIHAYEFSSVTKTPHSAHYTTHAEDCHEAKNASFFASVDFCSSFFKNDYPLLSYDLKLKIQNGFVSPFLEPRKKPPRHV
jgi:hypothetical protein